MLKFLNKGISTPLAITIIIVLAVVLIGGIFSYQYYYLPKQENQTEIPEIKTPEIQKDETADWKTYRSEKYGFEVKYPSSPNWEINKEIDAPFIVHFGPEWCITIVGYGENPQNLNIKKFCEEKYKRITIEEAPFSDDPCWHILYKEPTLINMESKEAFQAKRVGGPLATTQTLVPANNFILSISKIESDYSGYQGGCHLINTDKIYNQMLSTFRFIEE